MTLVLKGIDSEVIKETKRVIEEEIYKSAPFTKIDEKPQIIKVRFRIMVMADKVKESGLRIFWFSIPPRNIVYEWYTNIPQCIVCYGYDHVKNAYPNKEKIICSECAQEGHILRNCPNKDNPRSINYNENHRTLSGKCKIRKEMGKLENKITTKDGITIQCGS